MRLSTLPSLSLLVTTLGYLRNVQPPTVRKSGHGSTNHVAALFPRHIRVSFHDMIDILAKLVAVFVAKLFIPFDILLGRTPPFAIITSPAALRWTARTTIMRIETLQLIL